MLLALFQHVQADDVGDHGHNVKGGGDVIAEVSVVNQPQDLGDEDHDLQPGSVLGVQIPGEDGGCDDGQPGDPAGAEGADGQNHLQHDEADLQCQGGIVLDENQITQDGDGIADKTADTAENQMTGTHECALDALGDQNVMLLLQKTDGNHDQAAHKGNCIADKESIHENYIFIT